MKFESYSSEQTQKIAYEAGLNAKNGDIFCLNGDLGAGKTVFAKGFARGLGIDGDVASPTFSIINEHVGRLALYHFDVYRIKSLCEMEDTGYEDYFYGGGVCLIEWADLIKPLLPANAVWVTIRKRLENGENYREIDIS